MVIRWAQPLTDAVTAAIDDARQGRASALTILGDAGMGKTTLLLDVSRWASTFVVLEAGGEQTAYQQPFRLLQHLGIDDLRTPAGSWKDPLAVAQALRDRVDGLSPGGPVLILLDDLQWVDQGSLEALYWLVRRAEADRLLVVLASRPETAQRGDAWRRLVQETSRSHEPLRLTGLSLEQTAALVYEVDRAADPTMIARLREHTGGNPFYLKSLLRQYHTAELSSMPFLPAPIELARQIQVEMDGVGYEAQAVIQASAVLGYSWQDPARLIQIANIDDATIAIEVALASGLLVAQGPDAGAALRISHALTRAAIYQSMGRVRRQEMHLRAAENASTIMEALEQRFAASGQVDERLADDLEHAADLAHDSGDFAQAGLLLRWSSARSGVVAVRNRRWLDAAFELILARDVAPVREQLSAIRSSSDEARRTLLQAMMLGVEKRWLDAWSTYTSISANTLADADPVTRYRLLVLTAWAIICSGRDVEEMAPLLQQAAAGQGADRALIGNEIFAHGMLAARRGDRAALSAALESVPVSASATPMQLTYKLAWRGSIRAFFGDAAAAESDLLEVTTRIRTGVADNSDGVYHALLAFARWQSGAWDLARIDMGIALDCAIGQPHPLSRAIAPMLLAVRGDLDRADAALREAREVLTVMPWRQGLYLYVISSVARLHASDNVEARQLELSHLRTTFGDSVTTEFGFTGALWTVHLTLAAIWAADYELAETFIARSRQQPALAGWMPWISHWLRALIAEATGTPVAAADHLARAVRGFTKDLPLYRAHIHADNARVADLQGDPATAQRSAQAARQLYTVLGATPYLHHAIPGTAPSQRKSEHTPDLLAVLTDRERDVATLLLAGLSYAQIARDLYVTRATIGFHTGRIYAKVGVTSRAEFIDLTRQRGPS